MTQAGSSTPLADRRVLVTGGSRGIGAGIVRRLAADGAAVAFTYGASAAEAEKLVGDLTSEGAKVTAIQADSADPDQVAAAVSQAVADLGGLDVLVNNAGVAHVAPAEEFTREQFDRLVNVNIGGVFWAIHAAIPHFGAGSRIINIGSINADRVPAPNLGVYAMTKGAVQALTIGLARELGPRGITITNVQPGPIDTDMNPADGGLAEVMTSVTALGRYGHAGDIAAVVSFLAGPESGYVTGASWNVDGGYTA
ncbi:SDR family NAD(P)-dependent oxidoreductase [Mycolicibacterium smegmatis]|uniref:Putative oxidoreductase YjgI n=1 Tax=Mycolicibacterium smegmatis (strain MKD8) TaxID=1214915 RepID=A0A2U9PTZ1_MYCSE|nr:SDR family oxidoreductase [Mycolicibacterium smegmatis]AWT55227.1 putative oxidoreductase YjgI [Mycolicibacterium smegmatis MKD8]